MTKAQDIYHSTVLLQTAVEKLGRAMRARGLPGDPALIELECTRIAQNLTDATGMPLARSLARAARQVDVRRTRIEEGH